MPEPLLPHILGLHGRWRAAQPALVTDDETLDWATFDGLTNQVANGLIAAGCARGDRVGVVMGNSAAMAEVLFGVLKAGAVVAPLNTTLPGESLEVMLADADVSAVFISAEQPDWRSLGGKVPLRVATGGQADGSWLDFTSWRDAQASADPGVALSRDEVCTIIYSSGTTGRPKGIVHTHGARLDWAHDLAHALRYHSGARTLVATGLYSNITWAGMLPTLLLGGTLFIRRSFGPVDVLRTIEHERITHTSMVPVQYQRILEHPEFNSFDRASMQAMMCCGAPLPLAVKQKLFETFSCGVIELYGSTEGIITTLAPEEAPDHMASVGKPLPGEDLAILGAEDGFAQPEEAGEVIALSRFAMSGYWSNPQATEEAFWTDRQGRRWLRSGDIGRIDDQGYLTITDRKKDMIISGGQNVYPADIEAVLARHPSIADCAVFGVPSERWGETPLALVVLRQPNGASAEDVREWANRQLGKQQRLHAVEIRESLPRNANGKLLKRELRAAYWAMPADDAPR